MRFPAEIHSAECPLQSQGGLPLPSASMRIEHPRLSGWSLFWFRSRSESSKAMRRMSWMWPGAGGTCSSRRLWTGECGRVSVDG